MQLPAHLKGEPQGRWALLQEQVPKQTATGETRLLKVQGEAGGAAETVEQPLWSAFAQHPEQEAMLEQKLQQE